MSAIFLDARSKLCYTGTQLNWGNVFMKAQTNRLTFSQQFFIATMLFGLFFGAGNLIFPI